MSKYIDADKLEKNGWVIHRTRQASSTEMVYEVKKPTDFPAADVAEVQHGRWVQDGTGYHAKCSVCGEIVYRGWYYSFCPNCGAKMVNEDD